MFKDDNDGEEENTFGVTRYPCMPSLVALQQMKNRLQLANLGRKLMKWTALATGTELRNIAGQINDIYQNFTEDMRNAYILLARCRYFYPNLNKMVIEGVPTTANILLYTTTATAAGVKILRYHIHDNNNHPYEHLGIDKGGQAIDDAKKAWLELLKRIILMVELRNNFLLVEAVQKAANKKMNVLAKVVIPKAKVTCDYIKNALEELARDEFYRRKMILGVKRRKNEKETPTKPESENEECCAICGQAIYSDDTATDNTNILSNKQLEDFKEHISEILEILHKVDESTIQESNMGEFMTLSQELKSKLEEKMTGENLLPGSSYKQCETCKHRFETEDEDIKEHEDNSESNESLPKPETQTSSRGSSEKLVKLENYHKSHTSTDVTTPTSHLGVFEIDVKEITKIVRIRNQDGTIREEKKTIKIRREVREPATQNFISLSSSYNSVDPNDDSNSENGPSASSSKSKYSHNTTIQMITVNDWIKRTLIKENFIGNTHLMPQILYEESSKSNSRIALHNDSLFNIGLANTCFSLGKLKIKSSDRLSNSSRRESEKDEKKMPNFQKMCLPVLRYNNSENIANIEIKEIVYNKYPKTDNEQIPLEDSVEKNELPDKENKFE